MSLFFFFNDTATTEIYTLSLHDALPISRKAIRFFIRSLLTRRANSPAKRSATFIRSEEHTSELQSPCNLVCRLLLEKKNINSLVESNPNHDKRRRSTTRFVTTCGIVVSY